MSGGAAHLLLAARVYNGLASLIHPVSAIPSSFLDQLLVHLDERQREATEQLAKETLNRLTAVLDGWTPHGPYREAMPLEASLPLVESAIAGGHSLLLDYWTASREELTHRAVDPYPIEERNGILYMVAYCHLRNSERVFRIDRIRTFSIADRETDGEGQPSSVA